MNYFIFFSGVIIVILVLWDIMVTTLAPRGTGFITERLRKGVWNFFHWLCKGNGENKLLNYAGMFTVTAWLLGWIVFFWLGNALLYISDYDSVLLTGTRITATPLEKAYFVGYVLSTMGLGDLQPNGGGWRLYTSIISFSGFIIITMGITYLVPVLSAEMGKRKVSIYIHSIGTSPEDILVNAWNGKDFSRLTNHFTTLSEYIMEEAQNHVAYPVLHNFHSHLHRESIAVKLVSLDEALTILLLHIPEGVQPHKQEIYPLRYAITDYLATLGEAFIRPSNNVPGPLKTDLLEKYGIPLKQQNQEIEFKFEKLRFRRKLLLSLLENDGWHWDSIYTESKYNNLDFEHERDISAEENQMYEKSKRRKAKEQGFRDGMMNS